MGQTQWLCCATTQHISCFTCQTWKEWTPTMWTIKHWRNWPRYVNQENWFDFIHETNPSSSMISTTVKLSSSTNTQCNNKSVIFLTRNTFILESYGSSRLKLKIYVRGQLSNEDKQTTNKKWIQTKRNGKNTWIDNAYYVTAKFRTSRSATLGELT